ncbi:MAG: S41 family peptidase [Bacillota bacterium]|jgi:carboxyl-terminal processing protease
MHAGQERSHSSRRYLNYIALLLVVFIVGTLFGANVRGISEQLGLGLGSGSERFAKVETIYNLVRNTHVDPNVLKDQQAVDGAIRGMLAEVDGGYTRYETAEEARQFNESVLEGTYVGVGIQSTFLVDELEVEIVFRGSPAEAAGVRVRDRVIAVDGVPVKGHTQAEINGKIRGEEGTEVTLTILREGEPTPLNISIVRGVIALPVVDSWVVQDVGVVALYRFTENASGQLKEAILNLKGQGVKAILFDLRSNGGGLLHAAQQIAGFFLPSGTAVVRQVDRFGHEVVLQTEAATIWDGPLAILLNEGSASASEVVAGALQDHERATLLGERSYGKGTVQVPHPLADGSRVWVTQYQYLTPKGHTVDKQGLTPDVPISQPEDATTDVQLEAAIDFMQLSLVGA